MDLNWGREGTACAAVTMVLTLGGCTAAASSNIDVLAAVTTEFIGMEEPLRVEIKRSEQGCLFVEGRSGPMMLVFPDGTQVRGSNDGVRLVFEDGEIEVGERVQLIGGGSSKENFSGAVEIPDECGNFNDLFLLNTSTPINFD
jgi:hypothetical protein